jgi:hypothetical protein
MAVLSAMVAVETTAKLKGLNIPHYTPHQREPYDVLYVPTYDENPEHDREYNLCEHIKRAMRQETERVLGPKIHTGPVACLGSLLDDAAKRDEMKENFGIIGVKQGAKGMAGMVAVGFPMTVIYGIADYADSPSLTNKHWRGYAAAAAAGYAKELLNCIRDVQSDAASHSHLEHI